MSYYDRVRREITPLLPPSAERILDIGAGSGATLRWLKTIYPKSQTTGVEINPELHQMLETNADNTIIGDVDTCWPKLQTYDLVLLLDVLEHLTNPEGTLKKLAARLNAGGSIIVSVPNISHLSVSVPLLLRRRFSYTDAGILDRTHLRFFVEETAVDLLNSSNLQVMKGVVSGFAGPKSNFVDRISFGLLRHHLAKQYIMLGRPAGERLIQRRVRWSTAP